MFYISVIIYSHARAVTYIRALPQVLIHILSCSPRLSLAYIRIFPVNKDRYIMVLY